uniref:Uncharacterized protein n=1 Tax=Octopus bimaculoides TaxID=37653 RepID=A0A0L8IGB3_OCTBM
MRKRVSVVEDVHQRRHTCACNELVLNIIIIIIIIMIIIIIRGPVNNAHFWCSFCWPCNYQLKDLLGGGENSIISERCLTNLPIQKAIMCYFSIVVFKRLN